MSDIRINSLPSEPNPSATDNLAIDGATTRRATAQAVVNAGAPVASQAEAQAGTDAVKRMTPLTTKQSIASEVGVTIAGPLGPNLTGIKALTTAANKVPIFTDGSGGSTTYTVSEFMQGVSASLEATTALAALGGAPLLNPGFTKNGTFYTNNIPNATVFRGADRNFFGGATVDTGQDTRASRRITSLTRSGSTATCVCENSHDMVGAGEAFSISGVSQAEYNGAFVTLAVINSTTFTYTVPGTPVTPATAIAGRYMRMDQVPLGTESWLEQMRVNTVRGSYFAILSDNGQSPLATGVRTSDLSGSGYAVGPQFWAMNDAGVTGRYAWSFYAESRRYPGSDFTVTTEWNIANYGSEVEFNVYGAGTANLSGQLWLAGGGDLTTAPFIPNAASFGIAFINNGAPYLSGIAFASDSLKAKTVGSLSLTSAIKLGTSMMVEWFNNSNQRTAFITSRVNTQTAGTSLHFTDGGLYVMDYTGTNILVRIQNQSAAAINGVRIISTNTANGPVIDPHDNGDTNVDLNIRARGTGTLRLTDPSGTVKFATNATGLGFFATTPVAKGTVTGSRGGNAALASLLTQLAAYGLITDSSS